MNDKKKKIYIAIIVVCFLVSGGLLYYTFGMGDSEVPAPITGTNQPAAAAVPKTPSGFGAPAVFPSDSGFDVSVFESTKFKTLKASDPLTVNPQELGRDNPFAKY